ncbi:DNA-binding protein [Pseudomonas sp. IT-196MI5]
MKSRVKKCKKCGVLDRDGLSLIEGECCLSCRLKKYEMGNFNILKEAPLRLKVLLGGASLIFITLSIYAIYYQHLLLPGGARGQPFLVEFSGLGVLMPVFSLTMFSISFLSLIISNCHRHSSDHTYKKVIRYSFHAGWILYLISIFFFRK